MLGSFFYGYVVSQLLAGFVIGKFGAKWVFGVGSLVDAVLALLTPVVAKSLGTSGYVFLRIIQGLSEVTKIISILGISLVIYLFTSVIHLSDFISFSGNEFACVYIFSNQLDSKTGKEFLVCCLPSRYIKILYKTKTYIENIFFFG